MTKAVLVQWSLSTARTVISGFVREIWPNFLQCYRKQSLFTGQCQCRFIQRINAALGMCGEHTTLKSSFYDVVVAGQQCYAVLSSKEVFRNTCETFCLVFCCVLCNMFMFSVSDLYAWFVVAASNFVKLYFKLCFCIFVSHQCRSTLIDCYI